MGNGADLAALVGDRLLAEHEPAGGGEGGDEMQRPSVGLAIVAAARGLAVDGDKVDALGPALAHPGRERRREQLGVDAVHQLGEPARARHTMMVGQEVAQEGEMRLAPVGDPLVVVVVGDRGADHQQQHLGQRMRHAPGLARVLDRAEVLEQRGQP